MTWDDTMVDGESDIIAAIWNPMVTDQKTRAKMNDSEEYVGSDCTLTDNVVNRVLTISNTVTTSGGIVMVYKEGLLVEPSKLTVTHNASGTTIQFLGKVRDAEEIVVIYLTTE